MRLRVLSVFLAVQALSFGIWSSFSHAEMADVRPLPQISAHSASATPKIPTIEAKQTVVTASQHAVHFSSQNMTEKRQYLNSIKTNQLSVALNALPAEHGQTVSSITLDYDPTIRRGMGGNNRIILRGVNMGTAEMIAVMVHEVAHNVDYAYLEPSEEIAESGFVDGRMTLYESDPSVDFYRISWTSEQRRKATTSADDFVSGYAMADCFEDFAESYTYYVLHNRDFKRLAASNKVLMAKYRFMKYKVFDGQEFDTGTGYVDLQDRPWDTTVLDYDFTEFLS